MSDMINNINGMADDELAGVTGGAISSTDNIGNVRGGMSSGVGSRHAAEGIGMQNHFCKKCNRDTQHIVYRGNRLVCSNCGTSPTL